MAKKRSNNKLIFIISGVVVVLLIALIVAKKQGLIGKKDAIEIETAKAEKAKIVEKVSASGMVQPVNEVTISPDVSGEIIELHIEEGDSVHRGEVLLKIRPDIYQSNLERAVANLNQQKANLANSRAQLESARAQFIKDSLDHQRNIDLHREKVISNADFELSRANFEVSQSNYSAAEQSVRAAQFIVKSAEAAVREARQNLRFTTIVAPVTGTVSKLDIELGERVVGTQQMTGTEMLRIANLENMEARVNVNENDIIRVALGDSAIIDVDAYSHTGRKFQGVVTQIANTANEKTSPDAVTEFEVRIRILNESYDDLLEGRSIVSPFRPGMTASVDIITEVENNVLAVPLAAVTTREGQPAPENKAENATESEQNQNRENPDENDDNNGDDIEEIVFVVEAGVAKKVKVETGISDFDNIQVLEGLQEGDVVISGPFIAVSKQIKDGDAVKVKKDDKGGS